MNIYRWLINMFARFCIFLWWNASHIVDKDPGFAEILVLIIFGIWTVEVLLISPDVRKVKRKGKKK